MSLTMTNPTDTNHDRTILPSEAFGKGFYSRIGKKGGSVVGTQGGFAANRELAAEAGRKGGHRSSRLGIKNGQGVTRRKG